MAHYNGHLLSYNGACVTHHGSQQQLFNQTISKSLSQQILEHLKQFDVIPRLMMKHLCMSMMFFITPYI